MEDSVHFVTIVYSVGFVSMTGYWIFLLLERRKLRALETTLTGQNRHA